MKISAWFFVYFVVYMIAIIILSYQNASDLVLWTAMIGMIACHRIGVWEGENS